MNFAKWETKENMSLIKVNEKTKIENMGIPVGFEDNNLLITDNYSHSLIIGNVESRKEQTIILPLLYLANKVNESIVVHDKTGQYYESTKDEFIKNGYNVIKVNFDDPNNSNNWNPLDLPYKLYKDGNKEKAQSIIENIAYYLFYETDNSNEDPFWSNSATNCFTGLVFYLFENNLEISLKELRRVEELITEDMNKFKNSLDKNSLAYINLSGILNAPFETAASILTVYNQKMKNVISKDSLTKMLSKSDFELADIFDNRTILYVVSNNSTDNERMLPLLIDEIYFAKDIYSKRNSKLNVILDEFYELNPIKDFSKMLNYSRNIGITFVITLRSYKDLKAKYKVEETEIIKLCFFNIIYLLSQDIDTLEEISELCGKTSNDGDIRPLISIEELKTLHVFESIILMPRLMPLRTKLLSCNKFEDFIK